MRIHHKTQGDHVVVRIGGELDATCAEDLRRVLEELLAVGGRHVVLDLAALDLIDSSGVGTIVWLFKRLEQRGGSLEIEHLQGQPLAVFEILGLSSRLLQRASA